MSPLQIIFDAVFCVLFIGLFAAYFLYTAFIKNVEQLRTEKQDLLETKSRLEKETETQCRDMLLQAKNEAIEVRHAAQDEILKLRGETEREVRERRGELLRMETRIGQREETIEALSVQMSVREQQVTGHILEKENALKEQESELSAEKETLHERSNHLRNQLEQVSGLSMQEAREILLREIDSEVRAQCSDLVQRVEEEIRRESEKRAQNIIVSAIQRLSVHAVTETTVSIVPLPSDDIKGRIIGREGRNIRTFETVTGVDVIIDDTPEAVVLSSFDPVRREVARRALINLIEDGRIHPSRIEEMVAKAQQEVDDSISAAGEQAVIESKVTGLHPELVKMVGRMQYRLSYGQNLLAHSIEVSHIGVALASEIGANVALVRRACLLHDIGKVVPEAEGPHALISAEVLLKFGESQAVAHAAGAHHNELEQSSVEDALVQLADSISAARPGARREPLESYVRRLSKLEEIAASFPGVERTYAVQAGHEIRLIVQPDIVDDNAARKLSYELARRIEEELDFPGQIKVTVIREMRATDYAK